MQEGLGIAFTEHAIHMIHVKKLWGRTACHHLLDIPVPAGSGINLNAAALERVEEFFEANKIRSRQACVVTRHSDALYKIVSLPRTALESIQQVLEYEFENYFPFSLERALFDYTILNSHRSKEPLEIIISVIQRERFEMYQKVTQDMGLTLVNIEPPLTARISLFQWLQSNAIISSPMIVLDLHERGLDIDLFRSGQWVWKSHSRGPALAENVSKWILQCENLDSLEGQTEDKKNEKHGDEFTFLCLNENETSLPLLNEISRRYPKMNLNEALTEVGLNGVRNGSIYAFGSALQGIERRKIPCNFVPSTERKKQSKSAMYLFITLVLIMALLGTTQLVTPLIRIHREYSLVESKISEFADKVKDAEQKRNYLGDLKKRIEPLVQKRKVDVLLVLKELTDSIPQDSWLSQFSLEENRVQIRGESENANALIALLERSDLFQDVTFSSPVVKKSGKDMFFIEMKIEE